MTSSPRGKSPATRTASAPKSARGKLRLLPPLEAEATAPVTPQPTSDAPALAIVAKVSPTARARKVARLKAAVADGTYTADPREIAKALIESGFVDES